MPITKVSASNGQLQEFTTVPSPPLKIALIEPCPAFAAELGQLLSEALPDYAVELSDLRSADFVLMDSSASAQDASIDDALATSAAMASTPGSRTTPTILFERKSDGSYLTRALRGGSANDLTPLAIPLTACVRFAIILQHSVWRPESKTDDDVYGSTPQTSRLHQRLLQAQKMEAVGQLAGGIAHDFNNLLLVIRSYSEMLLEEQGLPPAARGYANEILGASRRAASLTRELLAFSRMQPLQIRPTNLNSVIDSAVPMLSRLVGKAITVWVQSPADLWPIQADVSQLEQVLVNLAANARDAMPRGGKFLLETANVVIADKQAAMPKGDYVMLAVSDTGCGIPKHILPRIFEPFFTTKERGKGTGLGLASVYGIVKQSGGYIWAYSESGYGTTFKIYIPRAAAAIESPEEAKPLLAARAASTVS